MIIKWHGYGNLYEQRLIVADAVAGLTSRSAKLPNLTIEKAQCLWLERSNPERFWTEKPGKKPKGIYAAGTPDASEYENTDGHREFGQILIALPQAEDWITHDVILQQTVNPGISAWGSLQRMFPQPQRMPFNKSQVAYNVVRSADQETTRLLLGRDGNQSLALGIESYFFVNGLTSEQLHTLLFLMDLTYDYTWDWLARPGKYVSGSQQQFHQERYGVPLISDFSGDDYWDSDLPDATTG